MKDFYLPDYKDGSVVNLMSSIAQSFGVKTQYKPLKILPPNKINSKNVVLLIIDGMGYDYLIKHKSILNDYLIEKMTSTFLPSTSCAVGTFLTGVAPQQHGFPGWYVFFKEVGTLSRSLRLHPKIGGQQFSKQGFVVEDFFTQEPFQNKLKGKAECFVITPIQFLYSDFNKSLSKGSKTYYYRTIEGLFRNIKKAINFNKKRKYIYSYWGELDGIAHKEGISSKKALNHFNFLNKKLKKFIKNLEGTDTTLIITSDHGFIDTPSNRHLRIENYPKINECLVLPPCGDSRTVYCYVRPSKTKQFEKYVKNQLNKYVWMFKSEDLLKENYFGIGKANPKLFDRIGDYALLCKENYAFDNKIKLSKKISKKSGKGRHGGVSKNEMIVPLIVVNC